MWLPAAPLVGAPFVGASLVGALVVGALLEGALLVGGASAAAAGNAREWSVAETQLVESLRQQLMRDNSDYSHETPNNSEIHRRADSDIDKTLENITSNSYVTNKIYQPSVHDDSKTVDIVGASEYKTRSEIPVSEKDLLYYVDEEKLVSREPEHRKYKTLKMRRQYRRSGLSQYIQEEAADGVSILSLGRAPFPELRLPRARRQYRRDPGRAADHDEGLPPPPADVSDRPAAADDVTQTTATS